jgi:cytochrome P450
MIEHWVSSPNGKKNSMIEDTSTLALNVISSVAFENTKVNTPTPGHTLSLRDALVTVMSTSISPAMEGMMPLLRLPAVRPLLSADVQGLLLSMREFRQYMDEMIVRERSKAVDENTKAATLISTLIKANDESKNGSDTSKAKLSNVELRGNIFIFTVGGLESTSITLSYALALLAVYPEIQDWIVEELDEVLKDEVADEVEYTRVFPRLKRVMAVMVRSC